MELQGHVFDALAEVNVMVSKRPREYLTEAEVERLSEAAKRNVTVTRTRSAS
jgi:hypothetical protein